MGPKEVAFVVTSLTLITISFFLLWIPIEYIKSKPLGQESVMDKPTLLLLNSLKVITIVGHLYFGSWQFELKFNEQLAMVLMWPLFNLAELLVFVVLFFSFVHQLVTEWPQLLEMNMDKCIAIFAGASFTCIVIEDCCFHALGMYPPAFYVLTGKAVVANPHIFLSRTVLFILVVIIVTVIRCRGCWLTMKSQERGRDNKVIRDKATIYIFITLLPFVMAKSYLWPDSFAIFYLAMVNATVCFPTVVILCNDKMLERSIRKLKYFLTSVSWPRLTSNQVHSLIA